MGSLGPAGNPHDGSGQFRPLDPEEFRAQAHRVVDFIADYYKRIESYPVVSQVEPGYLLASLPKTAPYSGEPLEDILKDIQQYIVPGMTHWLSPNFFAFFPATVSTAGFLGEMLSTSFNCVGFNWLASPAATELEMVVMDWLASMLNLPTSFMFSGSGGGVIQGTTSETILCTVVAARDRALEAIGSEKLKKLVVYGSDQTHSAFTKAAKLAGILPANIRLIKTTKSTNFALSPTQLRRAIKADVDAGFYPLYLCLTVGTTSTTAVDPINLHAEEAKEHDLWVHVDAAYAGSACICPEFRHYLDGIELVDSLSLGAHKWLLTYLDCVCLWMKNPSLMVKALNTNPEYLKNKLTESDSVVEYKDWQVGTGRKFKALRLWMVLRSYGLKKLQTHIRSDVEMARMFEGFVKTDRRFEIIVPTKFSLVCFRFNPILKLDPNPVQIEAWNRRLLERVNSTGRIYITHTIVGGVYTLRFAVGTTLTEERHVLAAWEIIKEGANALVLENHAA